MSYNCNAVLLLVNGNIKDLTIETKNKNKKLKTKTSKKDNKIKLCDIDINEGLFIHTEESNIENIGEWELENN